MGYSPWGHKDDWAAARAHTQYILTERRKGMLVSAGALDYSVDLTL